VGQKDNRVIIANPNGNLENQLEKEK